MAIKVQLNIFSKITNPVQKETYTMVGISLIVVLVMIFLVIRPAVSSVIRQTASNKVKTELVIAQEQKISTLQNLINQQVDYAREIELLGEALPTFYDTEYIIRNIWEYDSQSDEITVESIDFERKGVSGSSFIDGSGNIEEVVMEIQFNATYNEVDRFLVFLENYPRIFSIVSVSISPTNSGSELSVRIIATSFIVNNSELPMPL